MSKRLLLSVDPFRCRMWNMHDRVDFHITEESCREEIASFEKHGQLVPVLARPLHGDLQYDFELIYGARRLFIAQHLNKPLLAEISTMPDREAFAAMDIENRHRRDISPYERGLSYARWLRNGHFASQEELASFLKVSASQVSRLLRLARLPTVIVAAFGSALEIRETWGADLADALEDPDRRRATINCARLIASRAERPSAQEIYRQLLTASVGRGKLKNTSRDEVVVGEKGESLFRIRFHRSSVALVVPAKRVSPQCLAHMRRAVRDILKAEGGPGIRSTDTPVMVRPVREEREAAARD